ncbi:MAG: sigma-54-dependent Fis family transcriptional regulator [Rickettsiales bacterium]|nr:sigma-54-dependent Fis family transcriptional regulator [Rickettsiales bacterium]
MRKDILIVDDEEDIRELISGILQDEGYDTRVAWDLKSLKSELIKRVPACILLDVWLENNTTDGIDILKVLKKSYSNIPVIMISGHGTIDLAIKAIKIGAFDFIEKPFNTNILLLNINRAIELSDLKKQALNTDTKSKQANSFIGNSPVSLNLKTLINKVSNTESRILIAGPSGSGKKFTAMTIHNNSKRNSGPLVFANTKRILPSNLEEELFGLENKDGIVKKIGLIEQAHKGTFYIDEVANFNDAVQSRFVKLLTEKVFVRVNGNYNIDVDIRIIAGTSKNLKKEILNNNFREDLYYRLNVVPIELPSLNDRIEDIPDFIDYFLKVGSKSLGLPNRKMEKESYNLLQSIKWNGNLRQLRNVIEQLLILAPSKSDSLINANILSYDKNEKTKEFTEILQKKMMSLDLKKAREYFEREYISLQMSRFNNNVSKTAAFIGMERSALHRKLKILKIKESI